MIRIRAFAVFCVLALLPATAVAHHSFAMFDAQKLGEVKGTVTAFVFTNPHVRLDVMTVGAGSEQVLWSFEGGGTMEFMRAGIYGRDVKVGEKVTVHYHPLRDGRNGGQILDIVKEDGTVLRQKVLGVGPQ